MPASTAALVYLAGHIHSDWRHDLRELAGERQLPVSFCGPCEDHARSDRVGLETLDIKMEDVGPRYAAGVRDMAGGRINNLRTRFWLERCDLVIGFFDGAHQSLRQWNTASDVAAATRLGKPVIVVRSQEFAHSLKELGPRADVVVDTLEQAVDVLSYLFED